MSRKQKTEPKIIYKAVEAEPEVIKSRLDAAYDILFEEVLRIRNCKAKKDKLSKEIEQNKGVIEGEKLSPS